MPTVDRPTFTQVREAQRKLKFDYLEKLIEANEIIAKESREDFYDLVAVACLGFEKNYPFLLNNNDMGNLAVWVRRCLDFEDTPDKKQKIVNKNGGAYNVSNSVFWKYLLRSLYEPMSDALKLSLTVSAETVTRESSSYGLKAGSKIKND
jgi:hypothetical protein